MALSYAMTFGAVTLRLQIPIGFMLGYPGYPEMSVWLAYTSWIPNVIAVFVYFGMRGFLMETFALAPGLRRTHSQAA
jgi:hypothetical protein